MVWFSNKAVIGGHPAVNKDRQSQQNLLLNIIIIIVVVIFRVIYRRMVMSDGDDGKDKVDTAL